MTEAQIMDFEGALDAPGLGSSGTSLTLVDDPGTALPTAQSFRIRVSDGLGNEEWIHVTGRSGKVLSWPDTTYRGTEGSAAANWSAGATVEAVLTEESLLQAIVALMVWDYLVVWDGTNAVAYSRVTGDIAFGPTANFRTVWNQCVAVLAARDPVGGIMRYFQIGAGGDIPAKGTLDTCDGLQLYGPGLSRTGNSDGTGVASGNGTIVATTSFVNSSNIPSYDGNVLLDAWSRTPLTGCTAVWTAAAGGVPAYGTVTYTGAANQITAGDNVQIEGFGASSDDFNTVGADSSAVSVSSGGTGNPPAPTAHAFSFEITGGTHHANGSGGIVYPEGYRSSMTMMGCAFDGSNVANVAGLLRGRGLGQTSVIRDNIWEGGLVNVVQFGSRGDQGSNNDLVFSGNTIAWPSATGSAQVASLAIYVGDTWNLTQNNIALPRANAVAILVQCGDGGQVVIGPGNHIGGGTPATPRILWKAGQNGKIIGNYLDNVKDTAGGAIKVAPQFGSANSLTIESNHFHITGSDGTVPCIVLDATAPASANADDIRVYDNSTFNKPSAFVKFVSWSATKEVHIRGNTMVASTAVGHVVTALTSGDPAGQQGMRSGNTIRGITGQNGHSSEEHINAAPGGGATTSWVINHHLYGAPTHVQITPTNAAAITANGRVSSKDATSITITGSSAAAPTWDVFVRIHN